MVTGIKHLSQQQVISNCNTMGLNGLTAAQIPNQEAPVKRSTASDTRRVSTDFSIVQTAIFTIFSLSTSTRRCCHWFFPHTWPLDENEIKKKMLSEDEQRMKCGFVFVVGWWMWNISEYIQWKKNQLSDFN